MPGFLMTQSETLRTILTVLSVIGIANFYGRIRKTGRCNQPAAHAFMRIHATILITSIGLLAGYQARWQLFGFFSSDFLRVQRGFDPRDDILGTRFMRGDILDWKHRVLARDVRVDAKLLREYPIGAAGVHPVGYISSVYGAAGVEKELDPVLMGRAVQTPADLFRLSANVFFHGKLRGNPIVLTLDRDLQQEAWNALDGCIGAIVALDPRDGSIRAMSSRPGFDPSRLDGSHWNTLIRRADSPFLNRGSQGLYPPGSTFKPMVAVTALSRDMHPVFVCGPDGYSSGPSDPRIRDHESVDRKGFKGHGSINLSDALKRSCNVYFAQLAVAIGAPAILETAEKAGFHCVIPYAGPGVPGVAGRLPDHQTWHDAYTARFGIGQDDLLLTPLHLALAAGAIGHGGIMNRPKLVEGNDTILWSTLTDYRTANRVARMMISVVETGTGQKAQVSGIVVGGKTGTAETASGRSHSLFIGFAPWPRPALAVAVVVENGGYGGQVAAPIAGRLIACADHLGLLEDTERVHVGNE
ncbi:cell division protein FtsI [bacterium]|nr:cell division protein FtsI [candidate division CSSED10-310 bacterium]